VGKPAVPVQVLAIIGLASVLGGAHSLVTPVRLDRASGGFTLPDGIGEPTDGDEASMSNGAPAQTGDAGSADGAGPGVAGPAGSGDGGDGKISLAVAAQLHERAMMGEPVWFLDARLQNEFDAGHIAGALFMVHTRVSGGEGLDELLAYSPPEANDLLVIYCTGGDCQASEDTAILLEAAGYTNIAIMAAGYDEWVAAGLPTEGP
jgi:rhodanese-related sulfurtransferase